MCIRDSFMVFCVLGSLFFAFQWRWPEPQQYASVISIGVFGLIGQVFMTRAFQLEETSVLAPFKYMELVFALFFAYIIFGENYTLASFAGMGLIVLGMLINVFVKHKSKTSEKSLKK